MAGANLQCVGQVSKVCVELPQDTVCILLYVQVHMASDTTSTH